MVRCIQAVVLAIYGINQSFKPANTTYSYGHARIEVICGLVNGVFLLSVSLMMGIEVHVLVAGKRVARVGLWWCSHAAGAGKSGAIVAAPPPK